MERPIEGKKKDGKGLSFAQYMDYCEELNSYIDYLENKSKVVFNISGTKLAGVLQNTLRRNRNGTNTSDSI